MLITKTTGEVLLLKRANRIGQSFEGKKMHGKDRTRDSRDGDWVAGQRELYSFVNRIMYKSDNSTSVLLINISKMNPREYSFFHSLIFSLYKGRYR